MSNLATITNNILADSGIDDLNVIVSTGSYSNPAWITALSWSKITGSPAFLTSVTASSPLASSGGTTPNITIQQASGSQSGFLSSTDWTTFNNKQNALTNPVTGTGTTNYLPKFTGSTTVGNSIVQDNGSAIIATGNIQTSGSSNHLRAGNYTWVGGSGGDYGSVGYNIGYTTTSLTYNYVVNDFSSALRFDTGGFRFLTAPSGTAGNAISFTQAMTLDSSGNLLIGALSNISSARREIVIRGANGSLLSLGNNTTADRFQIVSDSGENALLNNKASTPMIFYTSNTEAMRISSSQNLLVGTTSDNGARLQVSGSIHLLNGGNRNIRIGSATNYFYDLQTTNDDFQIIEAGATPRLTIKYPNGNVGIGTTSPATRLMIQDTANTYVAHFSGLNQANGIAIGTNSSNFAVIQGYTRTFSATNNIAMQVDGGNVGIGTASPSNILHLFKSTYPILTIQSTSYQSSLGIDTASGLLVLNNESNAALGFNTNATERMRITSSGNVGIGTTSPQVAGGGYTSLHVNGTGASILLSTAGANITYLYTLGTSGVDFAIETPGAQIFRAGSNERMRITSGGNVLIGTTTDNSHKLRVNGTGYFDTGIKTGNPVGSTTNDWLLGRALVTGTSTPDRWIRVQIGNLYYDILAVYMGSV